MKKKIKSRWKTKKEHKTKTKKQTKRTKRSCVQYRTEAGLFTLTFTRVQTVRPTMSMSNAADSRKMCMLARSQSNTVYSIYSIILYTYLFYLLFYLLRDASTNEERESENDEKMDLLKAYQVTTNYGRWEMQLWESRPRWRLRQMHFLSLIFGRSEYRHANSKHKHTFTEMRRRSVLHSPEWIEEWRGTELERFVKTSIATNWNFCERGKLVDASLR